MLKKLMFEELQNRLIVTKTEPGNRFYDILKDSIADDAKLKYVSFKIFNVTNPEGVLRGEKFKLESVGPYVFRQRERKINLTFSKDKTKYSYYHWVTYNFDADLSNGGENDTIIWANPVTQLFLDNIQPLMLQQMVGVLSMVGATPFDFAFQSCGSRDLLFGCSNSILEYAWGVDPVRNGLIAKGITDTKTHSLLNMTYEEAISFGLYEQKTGYPDKTMHGALTKVRGLNFIPGWKKKIEFKDGMKYITAGMDFIEKGKDLTMYSPIMSRPLTYAYKKSMKYKNMDVYLFEEHKNTYQNSSEFFWNSLYYQDGPSGVCNLTSIYGKKIFASHENFRDGDYQYLNEYYGLKINNDYINNNFQFEPHTGLPFHIHSSNQLNTVIKSSNLIPGLYTAQTGFPEEEILYPRYEIIFNYDIKLKKLEKIMWWLTDGLLILTICGICGISVGIYLCQKVSTVQNDTNDEFMISDHQEKLVDMNFQHDALGIKISGPEPVLLDEQNIHINHSTASAGIGLFE